MHLLSQTRILSEIHIEHTVVVFQSIVKLLNCLQIEIVGSQIQASDVVVTFDGSFHFKYGLHCELIVRQIEFLEAIHSACRRLIISQTVLPNKLIFRLLMCSNNLMNQDSIVIRQIVG